jgi:hypothetical protein
MMKSFSIFLIAIVLALTFDGCDTKALNEPGVDVQSPNVSFVTPSSADTLGEDVVPIVLVVSDNDRVSRVELYLNNEPLPFAELTAEPWESSFNPAELGEGTHQLKAIAYDPEGNSAVAKVVLRKGTTHIEDVVRISLVEIVTSANCSPCGPQNEAYHLGTASDLYKHHVATIKYHVWWPFPTDKLWLHSAEWAQPRVEYLFSPIPADQFGAPKGWVGGKMINNKGVDWIAAADADMQNTAGAKIELKSTRDGNAVTLTIHVTGISSANYSDLRLHTAVTESEIEYNDGNSENIHYDVMRRMYPDASGESVTIGNNQTTHFTRNIEIASEWNPENLHVVVFLQSKGSKEVLQVAKADL